VTPEQCIGKTVMIGITHKDHTGKWLRQDQYHGRIKQIGKKEGIVVAVEGLPQDFTMPPRLECLQAAPPGEYKEHTTGAVVVNPDLICTWEVTWPAAGLNEQPKWLPGPKMTFPPNE